MHWLTRIAVFQRWITIIITAALIGVSILATLRLKQEMIPDIEPPMTTVIAVYPGASPDEVMSEVAVPIDEVVSGTQGLEMVTSTSLQNMAVVFAEYEYGTDMEAPSLSLRAPRGLAASSCRFSAGWPRPPGSFCSSSSSAVPPRGS